MCEIKNKITFNKISMVNLYSFEWFYFFESDQWNLSVNYHNLVCSPNYVLLVLLWICNILKYIAACSVSLFWWLVLWLQPSVPRTSQRMRSACRSGGRLCPPFLPMHLNLNVSTKETPGPGMGWMIYLLVRGGQKPFLLFHQGVVTPPHVPNCVSAIPCLVDPPESICAEGID